MSLTIKTEPMENRQLAVTIEVDQARVDQELRKAARQVARQYRIPGFRQGKAPYSVLVQYVGLPTLYSEFVEELGEEVYKQAIDQESLEPYAPAALDVETLEPLTYKLVVPLDPEVDLGDYRSLRLEEEEPEITEEEIDQQIDEYREQYAEWRTVTRPAQYGDTLNIDVRSVLVQDEDQPESVSDTESSAEGGETVVLEETDWDVTLDEENPMEPPGFDEALLGTKAGEEKEFRLNWPEDSQSIYAGKEAQFRIKINSIQAYESPELDDEFAQMIGPDFETVDDLRANIRETLLEEKKEAATEEFLTQALDALVEQSQMDYPPVVVEDQLDSMMSEMERQLRNYGIESLDAYFAQIGQDRDEYRETMREQAEITARHNLVISELYRQEGLSVGDDEIDERIKSIVGEIDEENENEVSAARAYSDMMRTGAGRSILESQILREKALDRLLAIVRGEELPEPPAEDDEDTAADEVEAPLAAAGAVDSEDSAEAPVAAVEGNGDSDAEEDAKS